MPDILVRDLDERTLDRLKEQARRHGRSLQGEARTLLERAAGLDAESVVAMFDRWDGRLKGRRFSGSVKLVREDRER